VLTGTHFSILVYLWIDLPDIEVGSPAFLPLEEASLTVGLMPIQIGFPEPVQPVKLLVSRCYLGSQELGYCFPPFPFPTRDEGLIWLRDQLASGHPDYDLRWIVDGKEAVPGVFIMDPIDGGKSLRVKFVN
jgi:hypothetical protein